MRTRTEKTEKTPSYVGTINPMSWEDDAILRGIRKAVTHLNRRARKLGEAEFKVLVSARRGKRNPNNWKYKNRFKRRMRLEDAKAADVYLVEK